MRHWQRENKLRESTRYLYSLLNVFSDVFRLICSFVRTVTVKKGALGSGESSGEDGEETGQTSCPKMLEK